MSRPLFPSQTRLHGIVCSGLPLSSIRKLTTGCFLCFSCPSTDVPGCGMLSFRSPLPGLKVTLHFLGKTSLRSRESMLVRHAADFETTVLVLFFCWLTVQLHRHNWWRLSTGSEEALPWIFPGSFSRFWPTLSSSTLHIYVAPSEKDWFNKGSTTSADKGMYSLMLILPQVTYQVNCGVSATSNNTGIGIYYCNVYDNCRTILIMSSAEKWCS